MFCLINEEDKCITSFDGWPRKEGQWKEGRSTLELARYFTVTHQCGTVPPNYREMLKPRFPGFEIHVGRPEHSTDLPPKGSGGPRKHDLHLRGTSPSDSLTVCVEAKADESFGKTINKEWIEAEKTLLFRPGSQKKTRLEDLLDCVWGERTPKSSLSELRYQLLHALVGTAIQTLQDAEKNDHSASGTGVLLIHAFETDETERNKLERNQRDLEKFLRALPNMTIPAAGVVPGCLYGPAKVFVPADFVPLGRSAIVDVYLGKLVTNLN